MSWRQRFLVRIGRCPYCWLHFTQRARLLGHLEWAHASRRQEWEEAL